jgi:hypothetical protein
MRSVKDGTVISRQRLEIIPGEKRDISFEANSNSGKEWYLRIRASMAAGGTKSKNNKLYLFDPVLVLDDGERVLLKNEYMDSIFAVIMDGPEGNVYEMMPGIKKYDSSITEFRGAYIYGVAKERGIPVVYNEFQTGDPVGNTAGNVYRGVFNELQYRPAVINWFCYAGGDPALRFAWMDVNYLARKLSVMRNQLEFLRPYEHIRREKRNLAVFIPPAAPAPVGEAIVDVIGARGVLAKQLVPYGPDVYLSDDIEKYNEYDDIILVLGYIDGKTDVFLTDFLDKVSESQRVIILCASPALYTDFGKRYSEDFSRSLQDVLPVSPDGGKMQDAVVDVCGQKLPARVSGKVDVNKFASDGGEYLKSDDLVVGWKSKNMLVLCGYPTEGLGDVIRCFMGMSVPRMKESGWLKILNTDTIAQETGIYSAGDGISVAPGDSFVAYDLSRSAPVSGNSASEDTVLFVFPRDDFRVLDAGTARVGDIERSRERISLHLSPSEYPFGGGVGSSLTYYCPQPHRVLINGQQAEPNDFGNGFFECPIKLDGNYTISLL